MAVTFVLGRAGSGKTRYCVDALLAELTHEDRTNRAILLVPEQASFQMERALALGSVRGGYWRAEVLSFSRLARRLLTSLGAVVEALSPAARGMALRTIVAGLPEPLRGFRDCSAAGFFEHLGGVIESLLRENISLGELAAAAERIADPLTRARLDDVRRVFDAYLNWLGPRRIDPAQQLDRLRARLSEAAWLRGARVWVDGFAGFTGQELATLTALGRVTADLTITLLVDPEAPGFGDPSRPADPLDLFQRTEQTYLRLLAEFAAGGVARAPQVRLAADTPRFRAAPDLARLEAGLARPMDGRSPITPAAGSPPLSGEVRIVECDSPLEEVRAAARDIRRRLADGGGALRLRDFAVITRDIEPLAETIAEVFDEFELPYFLDRRRLLRAHPLHRLVEAVLDAALRDCPVEALTRLLRTGLLPLSRVDVEMLDELVTTHCVAGAALWLAEEWPFAADEERNRGPRLTARLDEARRRIAGGLRPLALLAAARQSHTGAVWSRGLRDALERLGVPRVLEGWMTVARAERRWEAAELHRLAWEGLCGTLESVNELLGVAALSAEDATRVICGALADLTLGLAPPTLDQVLVSSIERSRHPDIRHAWLLGFNEGVFPRPPADDRILSRVDRERLAAAGVVGLAPRREEAFGERLLAYIALTRPSASMTISFARGDAAGELLLPSALLSEVRAALPGIEIERPKSDAPPVGLNEAARGYVDACRGGAEARTRARHERLRTALRADRTLGPRYETMLAGLDYSNDPPPLTLTAPTGKDEVIWRGSPSELETYLQCPFKHFAQQRLRLRPEAGALPIRWDLGNIAHTVIADVTRRAIAHEKPMRNIDPATWQQWLAEAWVAWEATQPADLAARRADLVFAGRLLRQFVEEVVRVHAERWRRSAFRPAFSELSFGVGEKPAEMADAARAIPPALRLATKAGAFVELTGKIDRVDEWKDERGQVWRLVYDYKSSPMGLRGEMLTGAALQVLAYLLALHPDRGKPGTPRPAGAFIAPLYPQFSASLPLYAEKWSAAEQLLYFYRPTGVIDAVAAAAIDIQTKAGHSPVARIKRNKDGSFEQRGEARPEAEITARLDLARDTILIGAEGIASGSVAVAPLVLKNILACRQCSFQSLCRFERPLNRPRAAERHLPVLKLDEAAGGEGDE